MRRPSFCGGHWSSVQWYRSVAKFLGLRRVRAMAYLTERRGSRRPLVPVLKRYIDGLSNRKTVVALTAIKPARESRSRIYRSHPALAQT